MFAKGWRSRASCIGDGVPRTHTHAHQAFAQACYAMYVCAAHVCMRAPNARYHFTCAPMACLHARCACQRVVHGKACVHVCAHQCYPSCMLFKRARVQGTFVGAMRFFAKKNTQTGGCQRADAVRRIKQTISVLLVLLLSILISGAND